MRGIRDRDGSPIFYGSHASHNHHFAGDDLHRHHGTKGGGGIVAVLLFICTVLLSGLAAAFLQEAYAPLSAPAPFVDACLVAGCLIGACRSKKQFGDDTPKKRNLKMKHILTAALLAALAMPSLSDLG
jgi:hypothetical protein